jgi:putative flippase GtrA
MLQRFARFCVVGGVGFVVDAGVLQILFWLGIDPMWGRGVSFPTAVATTWYLNRRFTFGNRPPSGAARTKYFVGQVIGALINLAAFTLALRVIPALRALPVIALGVGTVPALCFNFAWSHWVVFPRHQPSR